MMRFTILSIFILTSCITPRSTRTRTYEAPIRTYVKTSEEFSDEYQAGLVENTDGSIRIVVTANRKFFNRSTNMQEVEIHDEKILALTDKEKSYAYAGIGLGLVGLGLGSYLAGSGFTTSPDGETKQGTTSNGTLYRYQDYSDAKNRDLKIFVGIPVAGAGTLLSLAGGSSFWRQGKSDKVVGREVRELNSSVSMVRTTVSPLEIEATVRTPIGARRVQMMNGRASIEFSAVEAQQMALYTPGAIVEIAGQTFQLAFSNSNSNAHARRFRATLEALYKANPDISAARLVDEAPTVENFERHPEIVRILYDFQEFVVAEQNLRRRVTDLKAEDPALTLFNMRPGKKVILIHGTSKLFEDEPVEKVNEETVTNFFWKTGNLDGKPVIGLGRLRHNAPLMKFVVETEGLYEIDEYGRPRLYRPYPKFQGQTFEAQGTAYIWSKKSKLTTKAGTFENCWQAISQTPSEDYLGRNSVAESKVYTYCPDVGEVMWEVVFKRANGKVVARTLNEMVEYYPGD